MYDYWLWRLRIYEGTTVPYLSASLVLTCPLSNHPFLFSRDKKKKSSLTDPSQPPLDDQEPEPFTLDTNLEVMDGIVDLSRVASPDTTHSPESIISDSSSSFTMITASDFHNPFSRSAVGESSRRDPKEGVGPKEKAAHIPRPYVRIPGSPSWTAPESWAVETGREMVEPDEESSSDESGGETGEHRIKFAPNANLQVDKVPEPVHHRRKRTRTVRAGGRVQKSYNIRIYLYRPANAFHIVKLPLQVTVAALTPHLNEKLLEGKDTEQHRLYLIERGRGGWFVFQFGNYS